MIKLIGRRLLLLIGIALLTTMLVFVLAQVLPGDVGRTILGPFATNAQVARLDHALGYDQPLLTRYWQWLSKFVTGDWGRSAVQATAVRPLVLGALGRSLLLAAVALVLIVPFSMLLGFVAAWRERRWQDRAISLFGVSLVGIPDVVSGVVLLAVFGVTLHWLPVTAASSGPLPDRLYHLILPALALAPVLLGYVTRMVRAGTVQAIHADYTRAAELKGLPPAAVARRHVWRNAVGPSITVVGSQVGWLIGGLVVIEDLFNYPGIGRTLLQAANAHDVPVLEAAAVVTALVAMLANLLGDMLVILVTPRLRYPSA